MLVCQIIVLSISRRLQTFFSGILLFRLFIGFYFMQLLQLFSHPFLSVLRHSQNGFSAILSLERLFPVSTLQCVTSPDNIGLPLKSQNQHLVKAKPTSFLNSETNVALIRIQFWYKSHLPSTNQNLYRFILFVE